MPTQDSAALVLGYFRFLPPGEWVPAVSSIGVGEPGGRLLQSPRKSPFKSRFSGTCEAVPFQSSYAVGNSLRDRRSYFLTRGLVYEREGKVKLSAGA